jgi:hypothetical protein
VRDARALVAHACSWICSQCLGHERDRLAACRASPEIRRIKHRACAAGLAPGGWAPARDRPAVWRASAEIRRIKRLTVQPDLALRRQSVAADGVASFDEIRRIKRRPCGWTWRLGAGAWLAGSPSSFGGDPPQQAVAMRLDLAPRRRSVARGWRGELRRRSAESSG